jgi:HK97 family phage prohead protease/HK97 family phage major capsid protein
MPISPGKEENKDEWMSRCVPEMMGENGGTKRPQEDAVAACMQMWKDAGQDGKQNGNGRTSTARQFDDDELDELDVPEPDEDEEEEDFMDRCVEEVTEENDVGEDAAMQACEIAWEDARALRAGGVHRKVHSEEPHGWDFCMSDESVDRMGDIISADGWQLESFVKNPIALFNHNPSAPIGTWRNLRVEDGALRGQLVPAPEGTSARIDEIRKLVDAKILRAVSVGFKSLEDEPLDKKNPWGGLRFIKQELVECSLVAVPANPNALAVIKSLGISPQTQKLIFAKHGNRDRLTRRGLAGKHAETSRSNKGKGSAMSSLAQRITRLEEQLVASRDALQEHLDHIDDSNVSDADMQKTSDLNSTIAQLDKARAALVESERALGQTTDNGNGNGSGSARALALTERSRQTLNESTALTHRQGTKKDLGAVDYLIRAATVAYFAKTTGRMAPEVRQRIYGEDEPTQQACDLLLRAASAPALMSVTGWAAELVHQIYTDFLELLLPKAILARLAARGLTLNFGQAGRIIIPTRQRTPTLAGSFVGEGMAIPVRQGAFSSQTLTPKKVAVITVWSREMNDHSIPAIEGLLREAVQVDTSIAIDTVLIDANAATTIRPPGLLFGITPLTATAGGGLTALTGDLIKLTQALATGTYGNIRDPVWIVNPADMIAAGLTAAPNTGIFPFRDEIKAGTLANIPYIDSVTIAQHQMLLVDAADFVVVGGEAPRLEISDQATLHMEDTNPTDLVSGSPGVVATPQRSLFQTDSLALRLVMPLNWLQRRAGTIVQMTGTTWS